MNPLYRAYCRCFQRAFRLALPLLPYREPKLLADIPATVDLLTNGGHKNVLLVTDRCLTSIGLTAPLLQALADAGISCAVYDETVPNPTIDNVEAARKLFLQQKATAILAMGGGSSIDCAKIAGARAVKPRQPVSKMRGILHVHRKLPLLIAIPTTAGTGSETTLAAVITDAANHHKYPINDFSLIPCYALLDPAVTVGLPPALTATTGMDAMTHAVEAYIGHSTTAHTRAMAVEAVRLIRANLPCAVQNGGDLDARKNMLRAAYCAGIAFTQSYVGYVHGIAHSLGGQYGTPHGFANAVALPHVLDAYLSCKSNYCARKLAALARETAFFGTEAPVGDDLQLARAFVAELRAMNDAFGIPQTVSGIREADIPQMARHAEKESNPLYPVPVLFDRAQLAALYRTIGGLPKQKEETA